MANAGHRGNSSEGALLLHTSACTEFHCRTRWPLAVLASQLHFRRPLGTPPRLPMHSHFSPCGLLSASCSATVLCCCACRPLWAPTRLRTRVVSTRTACSRTATREPASEFSCVCWFILPCLLGSAAARSRTATREAAVLPAVCCAASGCVCLLSFAMRWHAHDARYVSHLLSCSSWC